MLRYCTTYSESVQTEGAGHGRGDGPRDATRAQGPCGCEGYLRPYAAPRPQKAAKAHRNANGHQGSMVVCSLGLVGACFTQVPLVLIRVPS